MLSNAIKEQNSHLEHGLKNHRTFSNYRQQKIDFCRQKSIRRYRFLAPDDDWFSVGRYQIPMHVQTSATGDIACTKCDKEKPALLRPCPYAAAYLSEDDAEEITRK